MPYIKKTHKKKVRETGIASTAGDLNYLITKTIQEYLLISGVKYQRFNDVIGVIQSLILDIHHTYEKPVPGEEINDARILHRHLTGIIHKYRVNTFDNIYIEYDILGALEGAKLELYRRKISPYEDIKIEENGDVYYK